MKIDPILTIGRDLSEGGINYSVSCRELSRAELEDMVVSTHYALKVLTDNWARQNEVKALCAENTP